MNGARRKSIVGKKEKKKKKKGERGNIQRRKRGEGTKMEKFEGV